MNEQYGLTVENLLNVLPDVLRQDEKYTAAQIENVSNVHALASRIPSKVEIYRFVVTTTTSPGCA